MADLLALVGGPKAIVGLLLPLAAIAARRLAAVSARYRILGFSAGRLDVVLTASASRTDPDVGFARPTTGKGSVQAFGTVVRAVGRYYRKLPITVHFASRLENRLDADLICVGGPRANKVTAAVLKAQAAGILPDLRFDDVGYCLRVGDLTIDGYPLRAANGVPTKDIGMLLMCASPFSVRRRHAVVCCGFTSYGTAGTAEWFFGEVLADSWRHPLAKEYGIPRRGLRFGRSYVAILEFEIADGIVIGEKVLLSKVFQ
jgi:hypothetical protein